MRIMFVGMPAVVRGTAHCICGHCIRAEAGPGALLHLTASLRPGPACVPHLPEKARHEGQASAVAAVAAVLRRHVWHPWCAISAFV